MQIRSFLRQLGRRVFKRCCARMAGILAIAVSAQMLNAGQNTVNEPPQTHSIMIPAANPMPDANDQMIMRQKKQVRQNFDAANELRRKQIDDDSVKLLILAKDLKSQMDKLGDKPVPEKLSREAAIIELLARDVQARMILSIGRD